MNTCLIVNLRAKDRDGQQNGLNDDNTQFNSCNFSLREPIISKGQKAKIGIKNAVMPVSFINVEQNVNDRFIVKLMPTKDASDANSTYLTVKITAGQYNTTTQLASEINTQLQKFSSTASSSLTGTDGGYMYTYLEVSDGSQITASPLETAELTCAVSTDPATRGHLVFSLEANASFRSSAIKGNTGTQGSATVLAFELEFGNNAFTNFAHESSNITGKVGILSKFMGFGEEASLPQSDGTFKNNYIDTQRADESALSSTASPTTATIIRTNYVYVRCNLTSNSRDSRLVGGKSNIIDKIPLTGSSYGTLLFHQPSETEGATFRLTDDVINDIRITLTDDNGRLLDFKEQGWEMELKFQGNFMD